VPRAACPRGHLLPVGRITPDRRVDAAPGLDEAPDERDVFLVHFAVFELPRQLLVCAIGLRDDHHTRRAPVEPVNDPGPHFAADPAQILHVMEQRVDERAGAVAGGRVHDHSRRLVEDDEVFIFVDETERQRLGLGSRGGRGRHVDFIDLACPDRRAGPEHRRARRTAGDTALLDQPLHVRPRLIRQERGEEVVEPRAVVLAVHDERAGACRRHYEPVGKSVNPQSVGSCRECRGS
jgi:hypothetical protein